MILIIGLTYAGLIWLIFFKLRLLPWNPKSRAISIGAGVVIIVGIFIALFQGSPGTTLPISVQSRVIEVASGVSGRIVKIHVEPFEEVEAGTPLFQIDPAPYQNEVARLEAQLEEAKSSIVQMQETLAATKASVVDLEAREVLAQLDWDRNDAQVAATVDRAKADLRAQTAILAQAVLEEGRAKELFGKSTISRNEYDLRIRDLETAQAREETLKEALTQAQLSGQQQTDSRRSSLASATAQLAGRRSDVRKAEAWLASTVEGEHVSVRQVREALATAEFNLGQTTTRAPSKGYVSTMVVNEGTFARAMPVMNFVDTERLLIAAPVSQATSAYIKPGDPVEMAIRAYPGAVVTGTVLSVTYGTAEAQLKPGSIAPGDRALASPNAIVRVALDEGQLPLQFGMTGSAAIYTDTASAFGVIRTVMIRMTSLLNYLF